MARILVVDDSTSFRNQLRRDLESAGHDVVEAENGQDGLAKHRADGRFDLVICDLNMPVMDGLQMSAAINAEAGGARAPIFMLSSERSDAAKKLGRASGVVAWVVKPYVRDKLLAAVDTVSGVSRA